MLSSKLILRCINNHGSRLLNNNTARFFKCTPTFQHSTLCFSELKINNKTSISAVFYDLCTYEMIR